MKNYKKFIVFFSVVVFSIFIFSSNALAAKFYTLPQTGNFGINADFSVDVKIDSEGDGVNAAQSKLIFDKNLLKVKSLEKTNSIFNFWPDEPSYSNEDGVVNFIGGTTNGVSGSTLQVLKINFSAKATGTAQINFDEGAITIDDGTGANILTETKSASFTISPVVAAPPVPAPVKEIPPVPTVLPEAGAPIPAPVLIERVPEKAVGLPAEPQINISLYPDPNKWYNVVAPFNVNWDLPADISDVAAVINRDPNFSPSKSEKLFNNKIFDVLKDGVSYLHVRFKNSIGWGPTAHYRLAIDTLPPLAFNIESSDGFQTTNPAPVLTFQSSDGLSGIDYYLLKIGDSEAVEIKSSRTQLAIQAPGRHRVIVRAVDKAGNSTEAHADLEIIPIESPKITFATKKVVFGSETGVVVKGTALPDMDVLLTIEKSIGGIVAEGVVHSDGNGNWDFAFNEPLGIGKYLVLAKTRDARGAVSLAVKLDDEINVKPAPIIKLGIVEIGSGGAALILLLILIAGFAGGYLFFKYYEKRLGVKVEIAGRDFKNLYGLIRDDLEKLRKDFDKINAAEQKFILERVWANVEKVGKYLLEQIKKIKE